MSYVVSTINPVKAFLNNESIPWQKNFKFSIEYSIGFLLIVFYRIFANSFL